jgi:hypothetical protein
VEDAWQNFAITIDFEQECVLSFSAAFSAAPSAYLLSPLLQQALTNP